MADIAKGRKSAAERLASLEEKKKQLEARAAKLRARLSNEERAAQTREKVIVGSALLAAVEAGKMSRDEIARLIDGTILNTPTREFLRSRGWQIAAQDLNTSSIDG